MTTTYFASKSQLIKSHHLNMSPQLNHLPTMTTFTILAISLLILQLKPVDSLAANIKLGPKLIISPVGDDLNIDLKNPETQSITCETDGAEPATFSDLKWAGPNDVRNAQQLAAKHIVEKDETGNGYVLKFKQPTHDDSGQYYCFGTYSSVDQLNASIRVQFYNPIEVSDCLERQILTKGSNSGKISCRVMGDGLNIGWSKDRKHFDKLNGRYKSDNDGIVINGLVDESDAGEYTITGRSRFTSTRFAHKINVEVHSLPEIIPYNGSNGEYEYHGVEGEESTLKCDVRGTPKPLVVWLDPQRRNLTSVGGYEVTPERGTLTIKKVSKRTDHGLFECFAYNSLGLASRNVSMSVDLRPVITNFDNKTVDENSEVTFECRSTGDPEPKFSIRPQGNQLAYKFGDGAVRRVDTIPEYYGDSANVYVHRLTMIAKKEQFGLHYCNATNRAGTAERYNHLFVRYAPDLSGTPTTQYMSLNRPLVIKCHIKAYPAPIVSWWTGQTQLVNVNNTIETSLDGQTHVINMFPPGAQQLLDSTFTCRAQNSMGLIQQNIKFEFTTTPGDVLVRMHRVTPTTVDLIFSVPQDGGDRIRRFKYNLEGSTLDLHNPYYSYRPDIKKEVELPATPRDLDVYTIKNLLPYYRYELKIRAVNDRGEGSSTSFNFATPKATRSEPPFIIKPLGAHHQHSTPGFLSDYRNAYVLEWNPPEEDNGDSIIKYAIQYYALEGSSADGHRTSFEQMNERPLKAILGPLDLGLRYKIEVRAINKYGPSDPASIIIYTSIAKPSMLQFESNTLGWLIEPSTPTLVALLGLGLVLLVALDLFFCVQFQMGLSSKIYSSCCRSKTDSVNSDTSPVHMSE